MKIATFSPTSRRASASTRAFSLLEILIAVSVLAIVVTVALPSYMRARRSAQNTQTIGTIRAFSEALETSVNDNRVWPADALPGSFPDALSQSIKEADWYKEPGIGGQYDWDLDNNGIHAALAIANPTADEEQLTKLDETLDDGVLGTGNFREVPGGIIYVLQENR